ncbi:hypothetical protein DSO57_1033343 [Entomophthora muscae]|uniref:Uncharacterized protein n=1 Tax=Entomophthora muscae TaxID=34485 RepID=A0ACC2S286_9FUNG|nr:hypothetical protein DSO57_1033343 [Entomophthora muscae]
MTDRGREFIGNEFTRLLNNWYQPTEELAPAEVQVHGRDARLVIGKVLEEFAVMQAKYKLLANHSLLLRNDNSSKPVPGYDSGHILGTDNQEPHSCLTLVDGTTWPEGDYKSFPMAYGHAYTLGFQEVAHCHSCNKTNLCSLVPHIHQP